MNLISEIKNHSLEVLFALILSIISLDIFSPLIAKTISNYSQGQESSIFAGFIIAYFSLPIVAVILTTIYTQGIRKWFIPVAFTPILLLVFFYILGLWYGHNIGVVEHVAVFLICYFLPLILLFNKEVSDNIRLGRRVVMKSVFILLPLVFIVFSFFQISSEDSENKKGKFMSAELPFKLDTLSKKYDTTLYRMNIQVGEISNVYHNLNLYDQPYRKLDHDIKDAYRVVGNNYSINLQSIFDENNNVTELSLNQNSAHDLAPQYETLLNQYDSFFCKLKADPIFSQYSKDVNSFIDVVADRSSYFETKAIFYHIDNLQKGLLSNYYNLQRTTKEHYTLLFKKIQLRGIIILSITLSLLLSIVLLSQSGNSLPYFVISIVVFLMLVQLAKPIDLKSKALFSYAWPYSFSNWYLPSYINDLDSEPESDLLNTPIHVGGSGSGRTPFNHFDIEIAWEKLNKESVKIDPTDLTPILEALTQGNTSLEDKINEVTESIKKAE